jgi:hypothetical protein
MNCTELGMCLLDPMIAIRLQQHADALLVVHLGMLQIVLGGYDAEADTSRDRDRALSPSPSHLNVDPNNTER